MRRGKGGGMIDLQAKQAITPKQFKNFNPTASLSRIYFYKNFGYNNITTRMTTSISSEARNNQTSYLN